LLKKTIQYTDFNGEPRSEDFYFHLSKAELVELQMLHPEGFGEHLEKIVQSEDGKQIIETFKMLVLKAYGQKSPDGKRFVKTQQLRDEFESSEAYSELFMSLVTDPTASAEFVNGIIPANLDAEVDRIKAQTEQRAASNAEVMNDMNPPDAQPKIITRKELIEMPDAELRQKLAEGYIIQQDEALR